MREQIHPMPLSVKGRIMVALIASGLLSIWILAIYAYVILPQEIPAHFGFNGEPTRYGDKLEFLVLPAAFSIAPISFLLLTKYRFTLINKHPYLINLPAFFTYISKIREERRGWWVNKYFEAMLCLGFVLTLSLLIIEFGIFLGTIYGKLPAWFTPFSLTLPIWLILPFIFYLRKMSSKLKEEAEHVSK
ncbi:MAG: hypothetical protein DRJ60_04375 [Thermoprotei archaeon]|nr:MAG: hypothetical protein DRJ60_04375 [Thermoprotei archaeon]